MNNSFTLDQDSAAEFTSALQNEDALSAGLVSHGAQSFHVGHGAQSFHRTEG
ncbi:hypothetical protein [Umezawaea sp. NPDC059074]|uniref:hypothetical protein n=1 Tax=Umezawaea sp. NPDC059074 TaxID=3346716 RepID=UPI0036CCF600